MNNAQEMSPGFVLMRLVSAAEDGRSDAENGTLSLGGVVAGLGREALAPGGVKAVLDNSRDLPVGLEHPSSLKNKERPSRGTAAAPDTGMIEDRAPVFGGPQMLSSVEAPDFDFAPSPGLRPQLLVFSNLMRSGEGILDLERLNQPMKGTDRSPGPAGPSRTPSLRGAQQHQSPLDPRWPAHPPEVQAAAELCHGHRVMSDPPEWPVLPEGSSPLAVITGDREGAVFELARRFGELGLGAVPKMMQCSCQSAHGSVCGGGDSGDEPTETSDALLVLEGLGSGDDDGLAMDECPGDDTEDEHVRREFLLQRKREIAHKMSGNFSISSFQVELRRQVAAAGNAAQLCPQVCPEDVAPPVLTQLPAPVQHSPRVTSPDPTPASTPRRRSERCASAPRTPTGRAGGEKTLRVCGKSKRGSLKVRLGKLFRTKSCNGSSHLLDQRPSVAFSVSSAGSLVDEAGASGTEQDPDSHRQPRLTRAHSAFSPASLSAFTGKTVSLVDVDILQQGTCTPHPPTPPRPPRRSLSLLDNISGPQPGPFLLSVMGASLQSLPLPLPPPPPLSSCTIQHSVSLNDAFLRALPHSSSLPADSPPPVRQAPPSVLCALRRSEASSFTASLRELEKCGWYWGPMNWEDAEMKLKGKPDGSFLVRDSSDPRYILSLSFRSQGVTHHTRMEHYRGTFSLWCHPKFEDRCHSVVEFIERAIMYSKNGKFLYFLRSRVPGRNTDIPPPHPSLTLLTYFKALHNLASSCISDLLHITTSSCSSQNVPLISYLSKFYYYDPEEEMYLSVKHIRRVVPSEQEAESQT
ncbi:suppressor of cytokine signaling 7 [Nothobranchius furzeri]|uniref:Suppressor of cytokine signaling 7 n=1 Tax=Nothobranchius furzeri TaxID=105023 RepID=A0A9D2Y3I6_NOTFU|nr:suppressor of cytokine signaling 7 [Nothobranchius furzeri]